MIDILVALLILYANQNQYRPTESDKQTSSGLMVVETRPSPIPQELSATASWYDRTACGGRIYGSTCKTASGEIFDEDKDTMACDNRFPLDSRFNICFEGNCVEAVCNDRGNFTRLGRTFDLSRGLFGRFADLGRGVIEVEYEEI